MREASRRQVEERASLHSQPHNFHSQRYGPQAWFGIKLTRLFLFGQIFFYQFSIIFNKWSSNECNLIQVLLTRLFHGCLNNLSCEERNVHLSSKQNVGWNCYKSTGNRFQNIAINTLGGNSLSCVPPLSPYPLRIRYVKQNKWIQKFQRYSSEGWTEPLWCFP